MMSEKFVFTSETIVANRTDPYDRIAILTTFKSLSVIQLIL